MGQPSLWDWITFCISLFLIAYAIWLVASSRLPFLDSAGRAVGRFTFRAADRAGRWTIVWIYWPIFKAIWRLAVALWELPGVLWRGPRQEPPPAPVSRVRVGLPAAYVAEGETITLQNAPSAPSVVRPSAPSGLFAPSAAEQPPAPPRLMVDRSREALIDELVAAGWSTTQIRALLKGTNEAIGQEVEAARARLASPRVTPLAGRELPADARFRE